MTEIKLHSGTYKFIVSNSINKSKLDIKLLTVMINLIVEYQFKIFTQNYNYDLVLKKDSTGYKILINKHDSPILYIICYYHYNNNKIIIYNDTQIILHVTSYSK